MPVHTHSNSNGERRRKRTFRNEMISSIGAVNLCQNRAVQYIFIIDIDQLVFAKYLSYLFTNFVFRAVDNRK